MEKLETPLTWILAILILGSFTLTNCCKTESNNQINNGFSWSTTSNKANVEVEIITEENSTNIDSIIEKALQEVDSSIEAGENIITNAIDAE